MKPVIYFVVPCYCEEDMLPVSAPVFSEKLKSLISSGRADEKSKVLFVDDGSTDGTWSIIRRLSADDKLIEGVRLAVNSGEDNAQRAGMSAAMEKTDCFISMDCDLQDDINSADEMIEKFSSGSDIVLGIRSTREEDPLRERFFSASYYFVMKILGAGLIKNQANCRLLSATTARKILSHEEASYLPALVSSLPLKKDIVYYKRHARAKGKTKYNFAKKLTLAFDSILLHARHIRAIIAGLGFFALICGTASLIALLVGASLPALWSILTGIFFFASAFMFSVAFRYKKILKGARSRNKTGFEIAETTF